MNSRYLLDTNILSDLVRNPGGRVARRIMETGEEAVLTSIIVAAELRFGAAKKASVQLSERVESILSLIEVAPFEAPADAKYAALRTELEAVGKAIGGNDMLIAAHALSLGATLVSANFKEFARVNGLAVEDWTSKEERAP